MSTIVHGNGAELTEDFLNAVDDAVDELNSSPGNNSGNKFGGFELRNEDGNAAFEQRLTVAAGSTTDAQVNEARSAVVQELSGTIRDLIRAQGKADEFLSADFGINSLDDIRIVYDPAGDPDNSSLAGRAFLAEKLIKIYPPAFESAPTNPVTGKLQMRKYEYFLLFTAAHEYTHFHMRSISALRAHIRVKMHDDKLITSIYNRRSAWEKAADHEALDLLDKGGHPRYPLAQRFPQVNYCNPGACRE